MVAQVVVIRTDGTVEVLDAATRAATAAQRATLIGAPDALSVSTSYTMSVGGQVTSMTYDDEWRVRGEVRVVNDVATGLHRTCRLGASARTVWGDVVLVPDSLGGDSDDEHGRPLPIGFDAETIAEIVQRAVERGGRLAAPAAPDQ